LPPQKHFCRRQILSARLRTLFAAVETYLPAAKDFRSQRAGFCRRRTFFATILLIHSTVGLSRFNPTVE
jgi:hypothetical protein